MESYGREYPLQLIRDWDKSMVGQREYKEALERNLYRYVVKGEVPSPMLVMGPTGSGKTFLPTLFKKSKLCPPAVYGIYKKYLLSDHGRGKRRGSGGNI